MSELKTWHVVCRGVEHPLYFVERHSCTTAPHLTELEARAACDSLNAAERLAKASPAMLQALKESLEAVRIAMACNRQERGEVLEVENIVNSVKGTIALAEGTGT